GNGRHLHAVDPVWGRWAHDRGRPRFHGPSPERFRRAPPSAVRGADRRPDTAAVAGRLDRGADRGRDDRSRVLSGYRPVTERPNEPAGGIPMPKKKVLRPGTLDT